MHCAQSAAAGPPNHDHQSSAKRARAHKCDHVVQFYSKDDALAASVADFLAQGLALGEACIAVVTAPHRVGIEAHLKQMNIDVQSARFSGSLVLLDAAETLELFVRDGMPVKELFFEWAGASMAEASRGRTGVRAFGEMVALLWDAGLDPAHVALEELWNVLAEKLEFKLFCAYPLSSFDEVEDTDAMRAICATHTQTVPTEQFVAISDDLTRQQEIALLEQKALALEVETRRRMELGAAVAAKDRALDMFTASCSDPMLRVSPTGDIVWLNAAAEQLLQLSTAHLPCPLARCVQDTTALAAVVEQLRASGTVGGVSVPLRRFDGGVVSARVAVAAAEPAPAGDGLPASLWHLTPCCPVRAAPAPTSDVSPADQTVLPAATAAAAAAAAATTAVSAAEAPAAASLDALVSAVSHELRTPLTAILGWAQVLGRAAGPLTSGWPQDLQTGFAAMERLARLQLRLVNDLIDAHGLRSGAGSLALGSVAAGRLLRETVTVAGVVARERGVSLQLSCPPAVDGAALWADADRLQAALLHLVDGAVRYARAADAVSVAAKVSDDGQWLRVAVSGHGPAVAAWSVPSLAPPHGLACAAPEPALGLGLGLGRVRETLRLHGGVVEVQTNWPLGGQAALLVLPLLLPGVRAPPTPLSSPSMGSGSESSQQRQSPPARATPSPSRPPPLISQQGPGGLLNPAAPAARGPLDHTRILIVDDVEDNRVVLSIMLRRAGAEVCLACHGAEAVDMACAAAADGRPFTLVLMDIQMPVMDGLQATAALRLRGRTEPVVALTAGVAQPEALGAFDGWLRKPIDRTALIRACMQWVGRS